MPKLTELDGTPVYILAPENVYMVHAPIQGKYDASAGAVLIPIHGGHVIAVRETPTQVLKILNKD
jgi:hypothetical protein